ncbi:retrotransposon protein, putative, ty1-copia subclass [Tanacetum coccineum]
MLFTMRETYVDRNPKSHNVLGIAPVAIIDRQLPFEYTIACRSTDVVVPISPASPTDSEYLRSGMRYMIHNEKSNKKSLKAKGKGKANGKGKDKQVYIPKPKNPKPSAKEHPAKDDTCHHCKEVGHCKRNCPAYLAELIKKKKQVGTASSSDVFIIELFSFPTKSWVYDTSCGTHICNTKHGLGGVRKLKQVEAIGSFDLVLPNGLVICLDNCHYGPSITRGVVSVYSFVENGFVYTKRVKHLLGLYFLWHYHLAHINKKRIEKLQQEGLLKSTDDESFDQCVSCLSGKMTRKSFPHRPERVTDLLGIIHTDVCGPLRHVSRQGPEDVDGSCEERYADKTRTKICYSVIIGYQRKQCGRAVDLEEIQEEEDTTPSEITSNIPHEMVVEHSHRGILMNPLAIKLAMLDSESDKWIVAMNAEIHHDGQYGMGPGRSSSWLDRSKRLIRLSQNAYMDKILKRYKMDNSKRGHIPMQERLDLNKSQGAQTPKEVNRMKNVPYASAIGSIITELRVDCYCNAGFEIDINDMKSLTGYVSF